MNGIIKDETLEGLESYAKSVELIPCQAWLGYHKYKDYDLTKLESSDIPESFLKVANRVLPAFRSDQQYNKMVLRQYNEGDEGKPHFDPRDVKGYVIVVPFGDYEGGTVIVDGNEEELNPGDIMIRQATIGFSMGPRHSVSTVESGTMYTLEILTFVKEGIS